MSDPVTPTGPLAGIRVVDLTHHLGGPLATMALGQMGADVVKVEPPAGDEWRHVDDVDGEGRQFHAANRDKRGIVLDLRTPEGREALAALIDGADVLVHSFSPGVAERLGAGAEEALARNPRLIHCSLSAFGPGGPSGDGRRAPVRERLGGGERRPGGAGAGPRHDRPVRRRRRWPPIASSATAAASRSSTAS